MATTNMHAALLVKDGVITKIEIPAEVSAGVAKMQELLGGDLCAAFRVHLSDGLSIDGYCDDEFLLKDLTIEEWNVVLETGTLREEPEGYPIGGPVIILGGDNRTGDSRSLTPAEMARFYIDHREGMIAVSKRTGELRFMPTLRYSESRALLEETLERLLLLEETLERLQTQEKRDAASRN